MNDDTTNRPANDNRPAPGAAPTRAAADPPEGDAGRTPAALLARALQARFAAAARLAVALGLIAAGAEEFTRVSTGDREHGFPEGSDYGCLYPQDDLSAAQAEEIARRAAQDVRAEAERLARGAAPDLAGAVAGALAEWEEGAEIERANMARLREEQDREEEEAEQRRGGDAAAGETAPAAVTLDDALASLVPGLSLSKERGT